MQDQQALEAIDAIMDAADLSPEDVLDYFAEAEEKKAQQKQKPREPVEVLREGLKKAQKATHLDNDQIGEMVNNVTGGAVGHWASGRTNPSRENRIALYRWIRSVENALNVDLLPDDFLIGENGERVRRQ